MNSESDPKVQIEDEAPIEHPATKLLSNMTRKSKIALQMAGEEWDFSSSISTAFCVVIVIFVEHCVLTMKLNASWEDEPKQLLNLWTEGSRIAEKVGPASV